MSYRPHIVQDQKVIDTIVDAGVRAELLFTVMESKLKRESVASADNRKFLDRAVRYEGDNLLDDDNRGVMMQWEDPLMEAHAELISQGGGKDVLNVGFGMGLVDAHLQKFAPRSHTIIEAHPEVYKKVCLFRDAVPRTILSLLQLILLLL